MQAVLSSSEQLSQRVDSADRDSFCVSFVETFVRYLLCSDCKSLTRVLTNTVPLRQFVNKQSSNVKDLFSETGLPLK